MRDKFTEWVTIHVTIPVGAMFLAYHTLNEEINGELHEPATAALHGHHSSRGRYGH
jgi:hypothetical protein